MANDTAAGFAGRFVAFDTRDAPAKERFDLWCSLFPFTDMAPLRRAPYQSSALLCTSDDGAMLARIKMDATLSLFPEDRSDQIMLNLFLGGRSQVRHGAHEDVVDAGTGFNLMDCRMPMRTHARMHESIHLLLPRARVVQVLGGKPAGDGRALRDLPDTPLGEILKAHLVAITAQGTALDATAAAHAMASVNALALAYLAQCAPKPAVDTLPDLDVVQFDAACRCIETQLEDPQLSADSLARTLGCSRTRLYQLFADRGLSVAAHVRELRLSRSRSLLRDAALSIGDVALFCGYGDLPAYSKAFKRRFGVTPSEWRQALQG
jgi:AraC-like DNA-binding protein